VNKFLQRFIIREGVGDNYDKVSPEILLKYENLLKTDKDESNIVTDIWREYGLCSYRDGLFWTINPDEYSAMIRQFPNISKSAIAFARTNLGNLFIYDKLNIGDSILFLNVHKGTIKVISTSFEILFAIGLGSESFWKEECYGKIELKVLSKHTLLSDECLTFIPALAIGGDAKIGNLKKVKIRENLEFLSQLHSN